MVYILYDTIAKKSYFSLKIKKICVIIKQLSNTVLLRKLKKEILNYERFVAWKI
jgi:hypothetical protein